MWTGPKRADALIWIVVCATAELLGIGVGALWWVTMDQINPEPVSLAAKWGMLGAKALSGAAEGAVLGVLQALALRRIYPRLKVSKWTLLTVLLAVMGWTAGSAFPIFGSVADMGGEPIDPPLALTLLMASGLGLALGAIFGAVQVLAFKAAAERVGYWVIANAIGWGMALPIIYAAASIGDPHMSIAQLLLQAGLAGVVAGLVLGCVTGVGLRWIVPRA